VALLDLVFNLLFAMMCVFSGPGVALLDLE
jgi:hypothetical protein